MSSAPAFQFYANDWLSSLHITLMSPAEEGAYIRLLCYAWADPDCSIPDDDTVLAHLSRLGEGWLKGGSTNIRQCFISHPEITGRLVNIRLLKERAKQEVWREKSRQGGIRSGKTRSSALKGGSTTVEAATGEMVQPNGNSSSSSSLKNKNKEKKAVPTSSATASGSKRVLKLPDAAYIGQLKQNAAYQGLDIDREIGKLQAWLLTPKGKGKHITRQRLVNWLNKIDAPMTAAPHTDSHGPIQVVL